MISRRLVRIKTLQALYAWQQLGEDSIEKGRAQLSDNLLKTYDVYLFLLEFPGAFQFFLDSEIEVEKAKYYPDKSRIRDCEILKNNRTAQLISEAAASRKRRYFPNKWTSEADKFDKLLSDLQITEFVRDYLVFDSPDAEQEKQFLETLIVHLCTSSDIFQGIIEDACQSWNDDEETVLREVIKTVQSVKPDNSFRIAQAPDPKDEDILFGLQLFSKVLENDEPFEKYISQVTENWDPSRIAMLDLIAIKMALAEYLYCPEIPVKVTINEYLDIIKDYSTPGSSRFLNGILDKLRKKMEAEGQIQKSGRGLREQ